MNNETHIHLKPTWHDKYRDPIIGGLLVGVMGSMKYILEEGTERKLTKGHHSFHMHEGTLYGNRGTLSEVVHCE